MKNTINRLILAAALCAATLTALGNHASHAQTTTNYNTPGFFDFATPTGVTSVTVSLAGGGVLLARAVRAV